MFCSDKHAWLLTFGFPKPAPLQLQHAGDQHCGGDGRLNEAGCQG